MRSAWVDGAPYSGVQPGTATGVPYGAGPAIDGTGSGHTGIDSNVKGQRQDPKSITDSVTERVSRVRQFEGLRGRATRSALTLKYVSYFAVILLVCGIVETLTETVRFASGGGKFMLACTAVIVVVGAFSTLFYVNLRNEIVEKVRHFVFGLTLIPGLTMGGILGALTRWEWASEGSLGLTLEMALPAIFLATVFLPAAIFVKEMVGIRTLYRSKLDDQEAVALWTRQDGLQR